MQLSRFERGLIYLMLPYSLTLIGSICKDIAVFLPATVSVASYCRPAGSWPPLTVCTITHRNPANGLTCFRPLVCRPRGCQVGRQRPFDGLRNLAPRSTVFPFRLAQRAVKTTAQSNFELVTFRRSSCINQILLTESEYFWSPKRPKIWAVDFTPIGM